MNQPIFIIGIYWYYITIICSRRQGNGSQLHGRQKGGLITSHSKTVAWPTIYF
jgi:hypothetical protein